MELSVAKGLIQTGINPSHPNQAWADLGAGDGLFTKALADLVPSKSQILAVDKDERALKSISVPPNVEFKLLVGDLNDLPETLPIFDGIVMANSLHYIKDQVRFLLRMKKHLKPSGVLILIEYNLERSNPWVPFPISKRVMVELADKAGFALEIIPDSVKSKLNSSEIYSALLKPLR